MKAKTIQIPENITINSKILLEIYNKISHLDGIKGDNIEIIASIRRQIQEAIINSVPTAKDDEDDQ